MEYLLLDCPVSTPVESLYTFAVNAHVFPVENRLVKTSNFHFNSNFLSCEEVCGVNFFITKLNIFCVG